MVAEKPDAVKPSGRYHRTGRRCKNGHDLNVTGRSGKHCKLCRQGRWAERFATDPIFREKERARIADRDPEKERARARAKNHRQRGIIEAPPDSSMPALCPECGRPPKPGKRLEVDHDHVMKHFRGWLCHSCNTTLGYCQDSPALLRRLADYLERKAP